MKLLGNSVLLRQSRSIIALSGVFSWEINEKVKNNTIAAITDWRSFQMASQI
ncbi:hypothetical protein [Caldibacillus sp. 210928-DFI.2.22]|uniref:hypothetical protein n=1 Tax=Caldibacillus sp. 210928-DFI.2.22 TaxID=2883265 RepID=UPI001D077F94|nr:hypothetical protein [Caldibacillus sp. 210928-DFI.2.22]